MRLAIRGDARRYSAVKSCGVALCVFLMTALSTQAVHAQATPGCTDSSRMCVMAAATTYLNALVSHNASQVWLAPAAIRTENGVDTGDSGAGIANDLQTNPQFLLIKDIRDVRWFVDGDNAIALYLIDTSVLGTGLPVATAHVAERFQVEQGLITQIEAFYCTHPGLVPESQRESSAVTLFSEQCFGENLLPGS